MPALVPSVPEARRRVVAQLRQWGADGSVCDSAELVTSELVTNAVLHSGSHKIRCELRVTGSLLRVSVADEGCPAKERLSPALGQEMESGRGLLLVDAFAERWGIEPDGSGQGRVTWAELPYSRGPGPPG